MSLPLFTESETCQHMRDGVGGHSCGRCRADLMFRHRLRNGFALPGNNIDFDCPHGKGPVLDPGGGKPTSRGLGDTVAKITKAVGIKPCGGCKRRQQKLNQLIPYRQETK